MKKITFISLILMTFLLYSPLIAETDNLHSLKQRIKSCSKDDPSCKETLQIEAEEIFRKVGKNFNDDFASIGNQISAKHCESLINEIFYHMDKLKDYHNYKDIFLLKKLKKIKENRVRLDQNKININDFNRLNQRAEEQYKNDIKSSQDFIDDKVMRITELCDNLNRNVESIQDNLDAHEKKFSKNLLQRIMELKNHKVWRDFTHNPKERNKIKKAILCASNNSGDKLLFRIEGIFSGFALSGNETIFPTELINRIAKKYSIY